MSVDILIPSMDNRQYLEPCLRSLLRWTHPKIFRVVVINNGQPGSCGWIDHPLVMVLEAGGNRGWTGGLAMGLGYCTGEYVCFMNDDLLIPPASFDWLERLLSHFDDPRVGAVGPSSNCTIGAQSIFDSTAPKVAAVPFLVGFCMLASRKALDDVGGVDPSLPGGDDIDLSIRLRLKFYMLLADRSVFVYHHGFVTGTKVYGPAQIAGGWNSREYGRMVGEALLAKHGKEGLRLIGWEV